MADICKVGKKYQIVIPKKIREKISIKENEELFVDIIGDTITIFPVTKSIESLAGIGANLYSDHYTDKIRQEWELKESL